MVVAHQVQARWKPEYADAPYREWFAQQRASDGWSCCDRSDAHAVFDAYIRGKANGTFQSTAPTTRSNQTSCSTGPIRRGMPLSGTTVPAIT